MSGVTNWKAMSCSIHLSGEEKLLLYIVMRDYVEKDAYAQQLSKELNEVAVRFDLESEDVLLDKLSKARDERNYAALTFCDAVMEHICKQLFDGINVSR